MKRFLWIALCMLLVGVSSNAQIISNEKYERHWEAGHEKIRIISYNIFNGFDWGKDTDRQERFVNWIRQQDPEILALQELCGFTQERLSALAKQWGHPYAVIVKENGYPVGITSKKPIDVKQKMLEHCGHGLLHVKTYGLDVLVTHLNPGNTNQRRQEAETITAYIKEHALDTCLLMGDMNAHSPFDGDYMEETSTDLRMKYGGQSSPNLLNGDFDYSVISRFLSYPLIDVCQKFTGISERTSFPTPILMYLSRNKEVRKRIGERLDYIFVTPALMPMVVDAFIYNGPENDYLSDHYPVGVDLCVESFEE